MILETWSDGQWVVVGTIGGTAGRAFLLRCRNPRPWRLRNGDRVWRVSPWQRRVVEEGAT